MIRGHTKTGDLEIYICNDLPLSFRIVLFGLYVFHKNLMPSLHFNQLSHTSIKPLKDKRYWYPEINQNDRR